MPPEQMEEDFSDLSESEKQAMEQMNALAEQFEQDGDADIDDDPDADQEGDEVDSDEDHSDDPDDDASDDSDDSDSDSDPDLDSILSKGMDEWSSGEHEAVARKDGWVPKDEYKGDGTWVSADEFNRRKPLFEKISQQKDALRNLERKFDQLNKRFEAIDSQSMSEKEAQLKRERSAAIKKGDEDMVNEIDQKLSALRTPDDDEQGEDIQPGMSDPDENGMITITGEDGKKLEVHSATLDFIKRNTWWEVHNGATDFATYREQIHVAANPDADRQEIMEMVEGDVRKRFPELFDDEQEQEQEKKQRRVKPVRPSQARGARRAAVPAADGGSKTYDDLPADARKMCDDMVRRGQLTQDEYVKSYFE